MVTSFNPQSIILYSVDVSLLIEYTSSTHHSQHTPSYYASSSEPILGLTNVWYQYCDCMEGNNIYFE